VRLRPLYPWREREIEAFVPVEYWSIHAEFIPEGIKDTFLAKLQRVDNAEPELGSESIVKPLLEDMEQAAYQISRIKRGDQYPAAGCFPPPGLYCQAHHGFSPAAI